MGTSFFSLPFFCWQYFKTALNSYDTKAGESKKLEDNNFIFEANAA